MSNCQVSEIGPLVANPGIDSGDTVELSGNPLSEDALRKDIPALEARGVTVLYVIYDAAGQGRLFADPDVEAVTFHEKGAIEGEQMTVAAKSAGNCSEQDMASYQGQWSNDAQLFWTGANPGDTLELVLPVQTTGRYTLRLRFTKGPDYAVTQCYLDGVELGEPVDLYDPTVTRTAVLDMGVHDLDAGNHTLAIEIVGVNEQAVPSHMVGLDYAKLEPAP